MSRGVCGKKVEERSERSVSGLNISLQEWGKE
jgi:hypothetical protein